MIRECTGMVKFREGSVDTFTDQLAIEEPLEIRLEWPGRQRSIAITMRTPGHDAELAIGFLVSEGMLESREELIDVKHCGPIRSELESRNVIKVRIQGSESSLAKLAKLERNFYMTSSCGVCGKSSIDALKTHNRFCDLSKNQSGLSFSPSKLIQIPDQLRTAQITFGQTGGLHGAALFSDAGLLLSVFEDVGRHNAVDKLFGAAFMNGQLPLVEHGLMLSGRISFELVQKASMAGVRLIAAIGAPSSLAVDLARELGITLVGFLRGSTFNVYTHPERIR